MTGNIQDIFLDDVEQAGNSWTAFLANTEQADMKPVEEVG